MVYMQSQQVLVPRQVYIGDNAEIRCNFEVDSVLLRNTIAQKGVIELSKEFFVDGLDNSKFEISSVTITSPSYNTYSLVVSFVPWHTGVLQLPAYDVGAAINSDAEIYVIGFNPQEIISISKTTGQNSLQEMNQPLLLPGTTYKIYGAIVSLLLLTIIMIRLIVKRKSLMFFINNQILLRKYSKNKKLAFKQLIKLEQEKNLSDDEVASEIQRIMRGYLEFRFDYPFTKTLASEMLNGFYAATSDLLSEKKVPACEDIAELFIRTDYIRYSKNMNFNGGEKQQIISRLMNAIDVIEKPDEVSAEEMISQIQKEGENA